MTDTDTASELTTYQKHIKHVINLLRELDGGEEAFQSIIAAQKQRWEIEAKIEMLDIQCQEGNCRNCDHKRPILKQLQAELAALDGVIGEQR